MRHRLALTAGLLCALLALPACVTAGRTVVDTVGTAGRVAVTTAGVAGKTAIRTASATHAIATNAASAAAQGAAHEGGQLAVQGVAATGQAGFRAMMGGDSSVAEETLAHRAGLTLSYPRENLIIGNVYEVGTRTDYTALSTGGEAANCYVMQERGTVSSAFCRPAPDDQTSPEQ